MSHSRGFVRLLDSFWRCRQWFNSFIDRSLILRSVKRAQLYEIPTLAKGDPLNLVGVPVLSNDAESIVGLVIRVTKNGLMIATARPTEPPANARIILYRCDFEEILKETMAVCPVFSKRMSGLVIAYDKSGS